MRTLILAATLAACDGSRVGRDDGDGGELEPLAPGAPTRSGAIVASGPELVAVNVWDGTVARIDPDARTSIELELGGEPTRVAVVGEELWVTLRAERSVAVLAKEAAGLVEVERFVVGAEPYGIVANPDASEVYVALSQEDRVVAIDAALREETRSWATGDDPRWLAIHPSGESLYVSYAFEARITRLDLRDDTTQGRAGPEPVSDDGERPLAGRATGDPSVSPDGDTLVVPVLYVDNLGAGPQPILESGVVKAPPVPYYVSAAVAEAPVGRFNATLVTFGTRADGRLREDDAVALFASGVDLGGSVRGYLASVVHGPGGLLLAAFEASDAVVAVDLDRTEASPGPGFERRDAAYFDVAENPYGVVNAEDGTVWVHERGTRSVARLEPGHAVEAMRSTLPQTLHAETRFGIGTSRLPAELEEGRRLFHTAVDPVMTTPGSGVSCNTCHFEGRNDGWTWEFDANPRQTPSLAGPVSLTAPVTWTDAVPTVAEEAVFTAIGRMGGVGIGPAEAELVAGWIDSTRDVDTPTRGSTDPLVLRGAELFADPLVGCASCHVGPRYTDNAIHSVHGGVNTPTLVGVSATPPYFHDGSSPTLRSVLERSQDGSMGSTAGLGDEDLDALEAFLRSL